MPKVEIPFAGPQNELNESFISGDRCINLFLKPTYDKDGKQRFALVHTPGLEKWAYHVSAVGEVREMLVRYTNSEIMYAVIKDRFCSIAANGTITLIGAALDTTTGIVSMATNNVDIVNVDQNRPFIYDISGGTHTAVGSNLPLGASSITYIDGYYLAAVPNTGEVWRSDYKDGSTWGALAFRAPDAALGGLRAVLAEGDDVYVFCANAIEIWYNDGKSPMNFSKIPGGHIDVGMVKCEDAVTSVGSTIYWLGKGEDGTYKFYRLKGRQVSVISTPYIEEFIQGAGANARIHVFSYSIDGFTHVILSIPDTYNVTFSYCVETGFWNRLASDPSTEVTPLFVEWRGANAVFYNNKVRVGDLTTGIVHELENDVYTDYFRSGSTDIAMDTCRVREAGIYRNDQREITIDSIQFAIEAGVGLSSGDDADTDPQWHFQYSKDFGKTWSTAIDLPMGAEGEYDTRCIVRQLGQAVNWSFKIYTFARVPITVHSAIAEITIDE